MSSEIRVAAIEAQATPFPMRSAFTTAQRSSTTAQNVRVTAALSDGTRGFGEASPAAYVTGETPASVLGSVPLAGAALADLPARRWRLWAARLREALPGAPTARSAVEMALLDALTRHLDLGLWEWFGGATTEVRTDLTIPIATPEVAAATARQAAAEGYRSLKIKVGGPDLDADRERVVTVARAAPGSSVRLDANQAFTPAVALAFVRGLLDAGVGIELLEQPVPKEDLEALAAVTRVSPVPVFADEAVVEASDAVRIAALRAAHGVNIKVAKAGLLGALEIVAVARAAGLQLMLGCMLESLLGIGASVHLACGTGAFDYLDLDGHTLIGIPADGKAFSQEGDRLSVVEGATGTGWRE